MKSRRKRTKHWTVPLPQLWWFVDRAPLKEHEAHLVPFTRMIRADGAERCGALVKHTGEKGVQRDGLTGYLVVRDTNTPLS